MGLFDDIPGLTTVAKDSLVAHYDGRYGVALVAGTTSLDTWTPVDGSGNSLVGLIVTSTANTGGGNADLITYVTPGILNFTDSTSSNSIGRHLDGTLANQAGTDFTVFWAGNYDADGRWRTSGSYVYNIGPNKINHQRDDDGSSSLSGPFVVEFYNGTTYAGDIITAYDGVTTTWSTVIDTSPTRKLYANGTDLAVDDDGSSSSASANASIIIGAYSSGGYDFVGKMKHLIIFESALSNVDRALVEGWLDTFKSSTLTVNAGINQIVKVTTVTVLSVVHVDATFTNTGISVAHTATINWGDGAATESGTITYLNSGSSSSGFVTGSHSYTSTNDYTVTVTVTVKDDSTWSYNGTDPVRADPESANGTFTVTVVDGSLYQTWGSRGANINGQAGGEHSGWSVSTNATGAVVAFGAPPASSQMGKTRIYEYDGSTWSQLGSDIVGEHQAANSGFSVSLNSAGTIVAIGAPKNPSGSTNNGQVRVYEYGGSSWSQLGSDIEWSPSLLEWSGFSVSLNNTGTIVAIGAPYGVGGWYPKGYVRIYEYSSGSWSQLGSQIEGDYSGSTSAGWGDYLGHSVSMNNDGTRVAMGAPYGENQGHVRVYEWTLPDPSGFEPNGSWNQLGANIVGHPTDGEHFGWCVSLSDDGNTVAIGDDFYDAAAGANAGHVCVYVYDGSTWSQQGSAIEGENNGDKFGTSVSLSSDGSRVAIGGPLNDVGGNNSGYVQIYEYNGSAWSQLGLDINGEEGGDNLGYSVSLSANGMNAAIGAPYNDDGGGVNPGNVSIFCLENAAGDCVGDPHISSLTGQTYKFDYLGAFCLLQCKIDGQTLIINGLSELGPGRWEKNQYIRKIFIKYGSKYLLFNMGFRGEKVTILEENGLLYSEKNLNFHKDAFRYHLTNPNIKTKQYDEPITEDLPGFVRNQISCIIGNDHPVLKIIMSNVNQYNLQPCRLKLDWSNKYFDIKHAKGCIVDITYVESSKIDNIKNCNPNIVSNKYNINSAEYEIPTKLQNKKWE